MQLISYSVSGFRVLADVRDVPVGRPTVLTGRNGSGKSAVLRALRFLLDGAPVAGSDFPDGADGLSAAIPAAITVTGQFELSPADRAATGLPERVRIRRVATRRAGPRLGGYEVEVDAAQPPAMFWTLADAAVIERLPLLRYRTGAETADVTRAVRSALRAVYREALGREPGLIGSPEARAGAESALKEAAAELATLIAERADGLSDVEIFPRVSARGSLLGVQVLATRNGRRAPLERSGAGRHKQVALAVWEWEQRQVTLVGDLGRSVVMAYDEPVSSLDDERQLKFLDGIRSQCAGGARAIIATHSSVIIDRVPPQDVVYLVRSSDGAPHVTVRRGAGRPE
jgi:energy-coupling factor transporter ATP-binding protein EcfA2